MPHMLDQSVYGPDASGKGGGMDWLAWSPGVSGGKREILARFAAGSYRPVSGQRPVRFIVCGIQSGSIFAAKSQLFDYRMRNGTTRPAWVTHFLDDFSQDARISDLIALEAGPFWFGPKDLGSKALRHPLRYILSDDELAELRQLLDGRQSPGGFAKA